MQKIEKIEREIDRKRREAKYEIKNKSIEQIIMKTKREIKQEEEQMEIMGIGEDSVGQMLQTNIDFNKMYFDHDDIDQMIDQTNQDMMHASLNQYPQTNASKSQFEKQSVTVNKAQSQSRLPMQAALESGEAHVIP